MRKSVFVKHINQLNEEDLRSELSLLYDKLEAVKKFYKMELGSEKDKLKYFQEVKKNIASKYATKSYRKPRRPRIQKVNTLLRDAKKNVIFDFEMIDVYLFTVETAVSFMRDYYYQSEPLYNNITKCFTEACRLILENRMIDEFDERCKAIISHTKYYTGLGSELTEVYVSYIEANA